MMQKRSNKKIKATYKSVSLVLMLFLYVISPTKVQANLDSLTEVLEQTMANRAKFDKEKEDKLLGLKQLIRENYLSRNESHRLVNRVISEYSNYCFDSTLAYFNSKVDLNASPDTLAKHSEAVMIQAMLYAKSSSYKEALDLMSTLDSSLLAGPAMIQYYNVYRKIYEDLGFYAAIGQSQSKYKQLYQTYTDRLLKRIEPDSEDYLKIEEKRLRDSRQMEACMAVNNKRLAKAKMGTPEYSLITFERSLIHEINGEMDLRKQNLMLSAISDIRASVKDNASLTQLSIILHSEGEVDRAYRYIHFALEDAEFFNSRLRFVEISKILPLITSSYQEQINEQHESLKLYSGLISLLAVIIALALFSVVKNSRKIKQAQEQLRDANDSLRSLNDQLKTTVEDLNATNERLLETDSIKEHYIANFLNICSDFIYKMENYQRMVRKLLTTRKFEELLKKASSQEFIDNEVKEFNNTFDTTFLTIYPDFVEKVNALLEDGEQIELKKGEMLSTELRIFALIRLGINDSAKISKVLRYSVNTIYNYRVKVKNKTKGPRDEFEDEIMKINAFGQ